MTTETRSRPFTSVGRLGVLLTVVGVLLAVDSMADLAVIYKFWPLLIGLLGGGFLGIYVRRARREASYAAVGVFLLGVSAIILYCSFTSWSELLVLWPFFITALGVALCFGYPLGGRTPVLLLAGLLLVSLSAVLFFVLIVNPRLWWIVLVLVGASFLIYDRVRHVS